MQKHIFTGDGYRLLRIVEADPECGIDYCDTCGDCLHCYGGDPCYDTEDGKHFWAVYENDPEVQDA